MNQGKAVINSFFKLVSARKLLIFITMGFFTILGYYITIIRAPDPQYESTASIKIETGVSQGSTYDYIIKTEMERIKSLDILIDVAKDVDMIDEALSMSDITENSERLNSILRMKNKIFLDRRPDSGIVNIRIVDHDPKFAKKLANSLVRIYTLHRIEEANKGPNFRRAILEDRLDKLKLSVRDSENKLKSLVMGSNMRAVEEQAQNLQSELISIENQIEIIEKDEIKLSQYLENLQSENYLHFLSTPPDIFNNDPQFREVVSRIFRLEQEKGYLLTIYTEKHPEILHLESELSKVLDDLLRYAFFKQYNLKKALEELYAKIEDVQDQLELTTQKGTEIQRLVGEIKTQKEMYAKLEATYFNTKLSESEDRGQVVLISPPYESTINIKRSGVIINSFIGCFIGFWFGVMLAFLLENTETSVDDIKEVEDALGASVLGIIPTFESNTETFAFDRYIEPLKHPDSLFGGRINELANHLHFALLEDNTKKILFSSSMIGEGKTTAAVCVALTLARRGKKILLVDLNYRSPILHRIFGIDNRLGIVDVIMGRCSGEKAINKLTESVKFHKEYGLEFGSVIENLDIMNYGQSDYTHVRLVSSKRVGDLIDEVSQFYDYVIVDTASILNKDNVHFFPSKLDTLIMVYEVREISRGTFKRAKNLIVKNGGTVVGIILNNMAADEVQQLLAVERKTKTEHGENNKTALFEETEEILEDIPDKKRFGRFRKTRWIWIILFGAFFVFIVAQIMWQADYLSSIFSKKFFTGKSVDGVTYVKRKIHMKKSLLSQNEKDIYSILIGRYQGDTYETVSQRFKALGFEPILKEEVENSGDRIYELYLGKFTNKIDAEKFIRKYNIKELYPSSIITQLIL